MKTKIFLPLVVIGFLTRLFLSITTYHQDLGAITLSSYYVVGKGEWLNFYDRSGEDVNKTIYNYQPLAYLIPATFYLPFPDFVSKTAEKYVNADWQKNFPSQFNLDLLFYKLPMIFADVLIFFILGVILRKSVTRRIVQTAWALNPVAIFVSSVVGQVDIFIALFLLLAWLMLTKGKNYLAIFLVSFSALIKPVGLICLPFLVLKAKDENKAKTITSSVFSLILGVFIYFLGISPFLGSAAYKHYALFADQINKTVHAGIEVSNGTTIPFFFIALAAAYLLFINNKKSSGQSIALVLLSSLVFANFHPQWFIWVTPLILLLKKEDWYFWLFCLVGWFLVLFSFDNTLHFGSLINSTLKLPPSLTASDLFVKVTLFGRALLVASFLWLFIEKDKSKNE